jgi:hypothetical protein
MLCITIGVEGQIPNNVIKVFGQGILSANIRSYLYANDTTRRKKATNPHIGR